MYSSDEDFIDDVFMKVAYLDAVTEALDEDDFFRFLTIVAVSHEVAPALHVSIVLHPVLSYPRLMDYQRFELILVWMENGDAYFLP